MEGPTNGEREAHRQKRRGPGPLEEPSPVGPGGLSVRVARPHTSVASLFAARFRVWIQPSSPPGRMQPPRAISPHVAKKMTPVSAARMPRACAHQRRPGHGSGAYEPLSTLPQWTDSGAVLPLPSAARRLRRSSLPARPSASLHGARLPATDPFGPAAPLGARSRCASASAACSRRSAQRSRSSGWRSKALILLLPKAKLFVTAGTALVSVAAYSIFFGWEFAAGFVVLLFLHEMGHVIALRREGIKASAPMFVPFMGAMIFVAIARRQRARGGARGPGGPDPGQHRRRGRGGDRRAHRQLAADRARLLRLLHQPVQPAPGRAAGRGPRDGGDGAVDVVPRLRRAGRAGDPGAGQPDPA